MNKMVEIWALGAIGAVGCGNASGPDPVPVDHFVDITPDGTGWVDRSTNPFMIQGEWYEYGDGRARGRAIGTCQTAGHADSECSTIFLAFPNRDGVPARHARADVYGGNGGRSA